MIDIAQREQRLPYLEERQVFPSVKDLYPRYFTGGISATVALASAGGKAVIVKQALSAIHNGTAGDAKAAGTFADGDFFHSLRISP